VLGLVCVQLLLNGSTVEECVHARLVRQPDLGSGQRRGLLQLVLHHGPLHERGEAARTPPCSELFAATAPAPVAAPQTSSRQPTSSMAPLSQRARSPIRLLRHRLTPACAMPGVQTLYKDWQRQGDRPLLYVNTFNHMMGNQDSNPSSA
jgi:hypothetical protein